jgi:pimeloyl-[acyl-carrier protein] methyl ester esterase
MPEHFKVMTSGQGPDLVLLHGWALHSGIWGGIVDALAADFSVHLVDLPGHGVNCGIPLSRDLKEVAKLILSEVPTATWIGWSLGGLVALQAALQQPQKVQKLVLVGATPSFTRQQDWDCGVDIEAQQAFKDGLEKNFEEVINQFCLQTFGPNQVDEATRRLGELPLTGLVPANKVLLTGLHLLYSNNLLPRLNACKMPTLFLGGTCDRTVRPESLHRATSLMPNAQVSLISGAGHAPFISHEEAFLDIIRGFLLEKESA